MSQPSQFIQGMMSYNHVNNMGMVGVGGGGRPEPGNNNMPLSFNTGKNKPPMARSTSDYDDANPIVIAADSPSSTTEGMLQQHGGMMAPGGDMYNMGYGGPMGFSGPDPSLMMMGPMMNQYGSMNMSQPNTMNMLGPMGPVPSYSERDVITLKSCVLYPPPPGAPPRSIRERPPGCRTAFIGGLPETCTEEILQEVFEKCGNIISIRLSKKNFAHIRYEFHDSVERSLFISGYRMKIDNQDDKPNTGRIHVDYALARDDQYEFECQQRSMMREMRHHQRVEEERLRPASPPPPIVFSDHEATALSERLKADEEFMNASEILMCWMEKGDCNRRSNASFYSMIQCVNSHVRRLLMEKQNSEEEIQRVKQQAKFRLQEILRQFDQIVRVFSTATKQRSWDHFTKAQRKNIDIWSKQAEEIRNAQQEEYLGEREEDEMEMSDEESDVPSKKRKGDLQDIGTVNLLKDENDTLRCQMEAYKNEVDFVKQESINSVQEKDQQVKALQNILQGMQQQLINSQQQMKKEKAKLETERAKIQKDKQASKVDNSGTSQDQSGADQDKPKTDGDQEDKEDKNLQPSEEAVADKAPETAPSPELVVVVPVIPGLGSTETAVSSTGITLSAKEAKILGLTTCFLHVHPLGASVDYLWSYLNQMTPCRPREIEDLLERLPMLFKQEVQGVGARLERRWVFIGYHQAARTTTVSGSSYWA